jgi:pimeloyl-ACP methyl ester carboxylesterase
MTGLAEQGFLELGAIRLEYRMIGRRPDAAPIIVMLHEGLGCVRLWGDFPDRVAALTGAGVFVYSRAGYGNSSPVELPRPLDFMQDEARDVLPRLLAAIGFRRGLLLGHSDGASIAAIHAGSLRDHRVRGLILMAPHFFAEDMGIAEIARARAAYGNTDLRARLARWHQHVDNAFKGWSDAWLDPGFRNWDRRPPRRCGWYPGSPTGCCATMASSEQGVGEKGKAAHNPLPTRYLVFAIRSFVHLNAHETEVTPWPKPSPS